MKIKKIFNAIKKLEGSLAKLPMPFGMTVTPETDLSTGNAKQSTRATAYYLEITPSTGVPVTDHKFGKLPEIIKAQWNFDRKKEPIINCEKRICDYKEGVLDAYLELTFKTDSIKLENLMTVDSINKEYMILFSGGEDADTTTVSQATRKVERMYLIGRCKFPEKYSWTGADGREPVIRFEVMKPVADVTLDCGDDASPTEGLGPLMPDTIVSDWGLDATTFYAKEFSINKDVIEYDLVGCAKDA